MQDLELGSRNAVRLYNYTVLSSQSVSCTPTARILWGRPEQVRQKLLPKTIAM
jgi:hypothetical protein